LVVFDLKKNKICDCTSFLTDHLRLGRTSPDDVPPFAERGSSPELHLHLHQLRGLVRQQRPELRPRAQAARRQRRRVQRHEEQAQRRNGRMQGTALLLLLLLLLLLFLSRQ